MKSCSVVVFDLEAVVVTFGCLYGTSRQCTTHHVIKLGKPSKCIAEKRSYTHFLSAETTDFNRRCAVSNIVPWPWKSGFTLQGKEKIKDEKKVPLRESRWLRRKMSKVIYEFLNLWILFFSSSSHSSFVVKVILSFNWRVEEVISEKTALFSRSIVSTHPVHLEAVVMMPTSYMMYMCSKLNATRFTNLGSIYMPSLTMVVSFLCSRPKSRGALLDAPSIQFSLYCM